MIIGLTFISFFLALVISLVLMPPFIKLMEKYRILDKAGGRKIHTGYTAHMGGVVIFIAFMIATIAMLFAYRQEISVLKLLYLGICLTGMLIIGGRDDMHNISPWSKLFFEIIIGIFMSYIGVRLTSLGGFLGIYEIPWWVGYALTICFFVVVVNAYNLIDGIDGQAGMQALNIFLFCFLFYLFVVGTTIINYNIVSPALMYISSLAILGAIVGFLRFNWQKARIFMGDTGSLFIGTLITIFIIVSMKYAMVCNEWDTENNSTIHTFFGLRMKATLSPFLFLFYLPLADTLRVFIHRVRHGKSPFHPDKTHIHHLFIRMGYSHQRCTITTFTISFCISIIGFALSLFFNDNICIPIIIASWFLYVKLVHLVVIHRFRGGVFAKKYEK